MNVQCDVCNTSFDATPKTDTLKVNGVKYELLFLICPECGKVYPSAVYDSDSVKLTQEIQKYQSRLKKVRTKADALSKDAKRISDAIAVKQAKLKTNLERSKHVIERGEIVYTENGLQFKACPFLK
ncbi:MAG: hypothetical protein MJ168_08035 [Clostridia bacterium]|nr:hypothetical protein [Clostridia bacterium]